MATLYEYPPECRPDGHLWNQPRTYLVGWDNQRDKPCRVYICRTCEAYAHREHPASVEPNG